MVIFKTVNRTVTGYITFFSEGNEIAAWISAKAVKINIEGIFMTDMKESLP